MVTVTLDEITLNATRAALDERTNRLEREIRKSEGIASALMLSGHPCALTEDAQRALVWNIAALHETEMAREFFAEVSITEHPVDATWKSA